MDMRDPPRVREAGFFMADEGTGMEEWGMALPSGPSGARVRRRASMLEMDKGVKEGLGETQDLQVIGRLYRMSAGDSRAMCQ